MDPFQMAMMFDGAQCVINPEDLRNILQSNSDPAIYKIVPIAVSSLAFLFSIASLVFSTYFQYLKKPKLAAYPGRGVRSFLNRDGRLALVLSLAVFNGGAQYATLTKISAKVRHLSKPSDEMEFNWDFFIQGMNADPTGKTFSPMDAFVGWAQTMVVPSREAVEKRIKFSSRIPYLFQSGAYRMEFFIFEGDSEHHATTKKLYFEVSEQDEINLAAAETDAEKNIVTNAVRFEFKKSRPLDAES